MRTRPVEVNGECMHTRPVEVNECMHTVNGECMHAYEASSATATPACMCGSVHLVFRTS